MCQDSPLKSCRHVLYSAATVTTYVPFRKEMRADTPAVRSLRRSSPMTGSHSRSLRHRNKPTGRLDGDRVDVLRPLSCDPPEGLFEVGTEYRLVVLRPVQRSPQGKRNSIGANRRSDRRTGGRGAPPVQIATGRFVPLIRAVLSAVNNHVEKEVRIGDGHTPEPRTALPCHCRKSRVR
jgi:hypothetical protein